MKQSNTLKMEGMKMTKKDYELFASFINQRKERGEDVTSLIGLCKNVFWTDNRSFKPEKFEVACLEGKYIRQSIKNA
jgi:hypothetical protein